MAKAGPYSSRAMSMMSATIADAVGLSKYAVSRSLAGKSGVSEETRALVLREAVTSRMVADVPLGAFLSGGVDSSGLVGLMSEMATQRIQTYSVGFEEKSFDELELARAVHAKDEAGARGEPAVGRRRHRAHLAVAIEFRED